VAARIPALDLHFPSVTGRPGLADHVSTLADEIGVAAVHETGPATSPVWRLFLADPARVDAAAARLEADLGPLGVRVERISVADEDWAARSQAELPRVTVGALVIAPPWDIPTAVTPGGHLLVIRPSMGFGTGHHETTRLCLRLLQDADLSGRRVVDAGTGSGVLAIAALRLGASDVEAIDYDEDALASARENLTLNGLEGRISLRAGDLRHLPVRPADVVVANLTGALLVAQSAAVLGLVAPGGLLLASGFLRHEEVDVVAAFAPLVGEMVTTREGEWAAFRARVGGG
jgi:ribosomal protein L11 methyltransferase